MGDDLGNALLDGLKSECHDAATRKFLQHLTVVGTDHILHTKPPRGLK